MYEKHSLYPLLGLGVVFVVCYSWPIIQPDLDPTLGAIVEWSIDVIWVVFVIDFVFRFILSRRRWQFIKSNWIDLIAIAVPAFRPLRALRIITVVLLGTRQFGKRVGNRTAIYVLIISAFIWFMAGLAVTDAERLEPGSTIHNVGQGWWWAFSALVVGSASQMYPVTEQGRLIEAGVFIAGLALLGTVSATLAAWFVDRDTKDKKQAAEVEDVHATLTQLSAKVDRLLEKNAEMDKK